MTFLPVFIQHLSQSERHLVGSQPVGCVGLVEQGIGQAVVELLEERDIASGELFAVDALGLGDLAQMFDQLLRLAVFHMEGDVLSAKFRVDILNVYKTSLTLAAKISIDENRILNLELVHAKLGKGTITITTNFVKN